MKQLVASLCMFSIIAHLFMGAMMTVHAADCHSQPSTTPVTEEQASHSCGCCHHHESKVVQVENTDADTARLLNHHQPHCTCLNQSFLIFTNDTAVSQKNSVPAVTQGEAPRLLDTKCYLAAAPSIGPPLRPDIGTHIRGSYASVVYCVFIA